MLGIPLSFLFFKNKDDLKWILIFFISFSGISIVLPTYIEPLIANLIHDDIETSQGLETYIENNIKSAFYIRNHKIAWDSEYEYTFQIISYIINNGSKNIDKPLQLSIDCSSNKRFILEKPDGNLNISYFSESVKPWVFGSTHSLSVRWNDSYAGSPLPKKSVRWVILNCYTDDYLYCYEFDYLDIAVTIEDEFDIETIKMPCFEELPSGHPKDCKIDDILQDIDMYRPE